MSGDTASDDINGAKANMDHIYDLPDPRAYFRELRKLGYAIPDAAKPVVQKLISRLRHQRNDMVHVLDLGCSYGVNAALLKHDLSMPDLDDLCLSVKIAEIAPVGRNKLFRLNSGSIFLAPMVIEVWHRQIVLQQRRITAQLIDSQTGHHLWAQRFDRNLHDLFEVQDEITQRIVAIIAPEIEMAEQRRASMRHPKSLSAWDLYQRGMSTFYKFREKSTIEARAFFERLLERCARP